MSWQSDCEERAARCEAFAETASEPDVAVMFKALAAEWRKLAAVAPGDQHADPGLLGRPKLATKAANERPSKV